MLDVSSTLSLGTVETLRFMGPCREEFVNAPQGILRHDVTLNDQMMEYRRRMYVMGEYRSLIDSIRMMMDDGEVRTREVSPLATDQPLSKQEDSHGDENPSGGQAIRLMGSTSSSSPSPLRSLGTTQDNQQHTSDIVFTKLASVSRSPSSAVDVETINYRFADDATSTTIMSSAPGRDTSAPVAGGSASTTDAQSIMMASTILRSALSAAERTLPCYLCAKDILLADFQQHVASCKPLTELLLRKSFQNPLRFLAQLPQGLPPGLDATDDEIDSYSVACCQCLGRCLVDCFRCQRKYNIHELQKHTSKCTGRSAGEILGNYTVQLTQKKS